MQMLQVKQRVEDYSRSRYRGAGEIVQLAAWLTVKYGLYPVLRWQEQDDPEWYTWTVDLGCADESLVSCILLTACFDTLILSYAAASVA